MNHKTKGQRRTRADKSGAEDTSGDFGTDALDAEDNLAATMVKLS